MAAEATPPLPGRHDVEAAVQVIHDNADRLFLWDYERDRGQLVTLYNKAMGSQWNSVTDLDWSIDVDPERLVAEQDSPLLAVARVAGTLPGSPMATWTEKEYTQLGIEFFKANLSQFMHGEQGAMMTAAKIVETVPWIDAKYYASTQTMDEARHTEVFAKYLRTKLGDAYPMSPFLKAQIWSLLEDSALGHRVPRDADRHRVAGPGRVRRHAAAHQRAAADEAPALRHVRRGPPRRLRRPDAVGVLRRPERGRAEGAPGVPGRRHAELAGPGHDARGVGAHGHDGGGGHALHHRGGRRRRSSTRCGGFARGFFAKLVPNVRKLGLLDANNGYLREKWGEAGLLEFEFADDTGSDYESYDAVARDRAAAAGAADGRRVSAAARGARLGPGPRPLPRAARGRGAALRRPHRARVPGPRQVLRHDERGRLVHDAEGAQGRAGGSWWRRTPTRFFVPKYVGHIGWVGVRLDLPEPPDWDELAEMIAESYCLTAPKRLAALVDPPAAPRRGQRAGRAPVSVASHRLAVADAPLGHRDRLLLAHDEAACSGRSRSRSGWCPARCRRRSG